MTKKNSRRLCHCRCKKIVVKRRCTKSYFQTISSMNISFWWIEKGWKMSAGHEHSAVTSWEAFGMKMIPGDWHSINLSPPRRASPSHSPCTVLYLFHCFPLAVQVLRILCKKFLHVTIVRGKEGGLLMYPGLTIFEFNNIQSWNLPRTRNGCHLVCLGPFGLIERLSHL